MAYKHNCGCGGKCSCSKNIVDLNCMDVQEWDKTDLLLGLNNCGKLTSVEKPLNEMTDLDREKLNKIVIDGSGGNALYNDGTYKPTYTASEVNEITDEMREDIEESIERAVENAVMYDSENNIIPRGNIVMKANHPIQAYEFSGNKYDILSNNNNITTVGNRFYPTNIISSRRPTVIDATDSVNDIAYLSDVDKLREDVSGIVDDRIAPLEDRVAAAEQSIDENKSDIVEINTRLNGIDLSVSDLDERVTTNRQSISDLI